MGTINHDKKNTNFKFESNIFVDNQKKFLSKLGIYNKKNIPTNFFISGNFDLKNIRISFYEISSDKKTSSKLNDSLRLFIRIINAYTSKEYTYVPWKTICLIVAGFIYFIYPVDLIPDFIPAAGFSDDLVALTAVISLWKNYLTPEIQYRAQRKLDKWFPN